MRRVLPAIILVAALSGAGCGALRERSASAATLAEVNATLQTQLGDLRARTAEEIEAAIAKHLGEKPTSVSVSPEGAVTGVTIKSDAEAAGEVVGTALGKNLPAGDYLGAGIGLVLGLWSLIQRRRKF